MHAATGDAACREKLNALINEWSLCIEPDGYFYSTKPPAPPHYIYEKMVGGLLDAHLYGGNPDALALLDRITAWAEKNLDHSNPYVFNTMAGITEWYTLSENLYRAYLITGQPRYRDYARSWEYTRYWDLFVEPGQDIFKPSPGYHAYSHVNTLSGAAAAYAVTGQRRYLDIIRNAYDYLQAHQLYATGGYGPAERMVPDPLLLQYLDTMENHWETQCCSWAAFKLAKYLMSFTGDARYGDWIERLLINGIGATLPMSADGRVMYYAGHSLSGACKAHNMPPWACCAGTRIQAVADYNDLIFFKDREQPLRQPLHPRHGDLGPRQDPRNPAAGDALPGKRRSSAAADSVAGRQVRPQAASTRLAGGTDGAEGEWPGCGRGERREVLGDHPTKVARWGPGERPAAHAVGGRTVSLCLNQSLPRRNCAWAGRPGLPLAGRQSGTGHQLRKPGSRLGGFAGRTADLSPDLRLERPVPPLLPVQGRRAILHLLRSQASVDARAAERASSSRPTGASTSLRT